jgi:hypothetical protein
MLPSSIGRVSSQSRGNTTVIDRGWLRSLKGSEITKKRTEQPFTCVAALNKGTGFAEPLREGNLASPSSSCSRSGVHGRLRSVRSDRISAPSMARTLVFRDLRRPLQPVPAHLKNGSNRAVRPLPHGWGSWPVAAKKYTKGLSRLSKRFVLDSANGASLRS